MVMVQELSNHDMANHSTVAECLIGILSYVIILMTGVAHCHLSGCQQTEFSLLGRGKSIAAPSTASSQCMCDCLLWTGVTGPYFFEDDDGRAVTVTFDCYIEMLWNFLTPELSSQPYGSSKMVQLPIQ
jgi:hypothetical protein